MNNISNNTKLPISHNNARENKKCFSQFVIVSLVFTLGVTVGYSANVISAVSSFSWSLMEDMDTNISTSSSSTSTFATNTEMDVKNHPFFSLEPVTKSLHPKFKLWIEMDEQEQENAMEMVGEYMRKYGELILPKGINLVKLNSVKHGNCSFDKDIGANGHLVCGPRPPEPCHFISFGINDDPSWDQDVSKFWGCRGFAGDPTVTMNSKITDSVTFHNIAASMLQDNEERLINKGGSSDWWYTSFTKLRYFLGLEKIDILKIDCEGCEVALARDMLREDPYFLFRVDQISIETHVTKTWMTTREHVYYFGLLLVLLEEAGFVMEWSSVFGCSKRHEITGCMPELEKYDWPCGYVDWPGHPNVVKGRSCQEYTWVRYNKDDAVKHREEQKTRTPVYAFNVKNQ